jgi:hypothetical protein
MWKMSAMLHEMLARMGKRNLDCGYHALMAPVRKGDVPTSSEYCLIISGASIGLALAQLKFQIYNRVFPGYNPDRGCTGMRALLGNSAACNTLFLGREFHGWVKARPGGGLRVAEAGSRGASARSPLTRQGSGTGVFSKARFPRANGGWHGCASCQYQ